MPFVNIQTVKGLLNETQKQELLERITDLMVEIEGRGEPEFRKMIWVAIDEREPTHWSLGGTKLTPEIIKNFVNSKAK